MSVFFGIKGHLRSIQNHFYYFIFPANCKTENENENKNEKEEKAEAKAEGKSNEILIKSSKIFAHVYCSLFGSF